MAYIGTMTDTAAQDGTLTACSSGTTLADGSTASAQMSEGASGGTTEQTIKNSAGVNSVVGFNVQSAPGEPGVSTWEAGDWVIRHPEVTTGNTNWTWQEVHVCEVRPDGTVAGTVLSQTGLGIAMSAGNHSTTATQGSDYTPVASDSEIYIVYVYDVGGSHGNEQFGATPSQDVESPITTSTTEALSASLAGISSDSATSQTTDLVTATLSGLSADSAAPSVRDALGASLAGTSLDSATPTVLDALAASLAGTSSDSGTVSTGATPISATVPGTSDDGGPVHKKVTSTKIRVRFVPPA